MPAVNLKARSVFMLKNILLLCCGVMLLGGCASLWDTPKAVAGFSIRDLEAARANAVSQVYQAGPDEVFTAVLEELKELKYLVFMQDDVRRFISVMNIPGAIDTTEVGIFVTELPGGQGVKVELSSRSTPARRAVAMALFDKLSEKLKR
jgi:hypothetical protein